MAEVHEEGVINRGLRTRNVLLAKDAPLPAIKVSSARAPRLVARVSGRGLQGT